MKNDAIRLLALLLQKCRKKKDMAAKAKRFLIVSTTALGDTLWATPSIKALRQNYPDAYIAVLTSPMGKEVLALNRHIDELFVIEPKRLILSLCKLFFPLRKKNIHTVLVFHISQRPILPFCFLLHPQQIIGTKGINKDLDFLLTKALEPKSQHEIERRLDILAEVGAYPQEPKLELPISQEDQKAAEIFLEKHRVLSYLPLVGIHPGAKDKFKQWPAECFIDLGNRLAHSLGCQVIVTGGPAEKELVAAVASGIDGAIALQENLSLRALAALIKKMSLFISNDTGPMHVAFAMETPTVALFAPTNAKLCGPYFAPHARVVQKPKTCTPCVRKKCHTPFCLLQISPQEVYDVSMNLFYQHKELAYERFS